MRLTQVAVLALPLALISILAQPSPAQPPTPASCMVTKVDVPAPGTWKRLDVTWADVMGETGYRVYRNGILIAEVGANITLLEDHSYPVPNDYEYCVEAFDGGGTSGQCCSLAGPLDLTTVSIEDWFQDAFPEDENPGLPGTAGYDVATALVKTGRNLADPTGDLQRHVVHGDSLVLTADADSVHLMFRIRPGPGNYNTIGDVTSGLPTTIFDFWGSYGLFPGSVSTMTLGTVNVAAAFAGHQSAPSTWSPLVWNSARVDTAELNYFPVQGLGNIEQLTPGKWSSTYHEHDISVRSFIISPKNRCFLINPAGPVSPANTTCTTVPGWVTGGSTGWDGSQTTYEGTKIIPDDLLTPGSHVQYFLRVSKNSVVTNIPDYTRVLQEAGERSVDGHRWRHFSVHPDRWRDPAFGGLGMATMLYLDYADRRGNERVWKGVADSTGATAAIHVGNADGYGNVPGNDTDINSPAYFIDNKNASPGTTWELYDVIGGESLIDGNAGSIGARLAFNPRSHVAPTPDALNTYYTMIMILSGDRRAGILGPFDDRGQDDIVVLQNWLAAGNTATPDRGLYISGEGFAESESVEVPHLQFLADYLGVVLRDADYRALSGNVAAGVDITALAPHMPGVYPIQNTSDGDVLEVNLPTIGAAAAAEWQNVGSFGPYVASVHKAHSVLSPFVSVFDGWDIARLGVDRGFNCQGCLDADPIRPASPSAVLNSHARLAYFYDTFSTIFSAVAAVVGSPGNTVDVPQVQSARPFLEFSGIDNNPLHAGSATLQLSLTADERIRVDLYDAAGRHVRSLLDRRLPAGAHSVLWDGRSDTGAHVPRGVYFARVRSTDSNVDESRRLVVLH